ncbi:hypothetical protein O6H91_05G067900 [Diphasiastrum complanatum]|uniref:Uncharacterized protein n=3 Tax=Diphasiastrum complanatum TaxID=34168 RepID=A0ACC2DP76_DIPCM|nr:hypothetical protein O6H91_05G064600 [Diphasiastrum complanatum]KAJ7556076.1 hypothetical protein O6H91_05G067900 [Diphasiastrum complanatum]
MHTFYCETAIMTCQKWRNNILGYGLWVCFVLDLVSLTILALCNEVSSEIFTAKHQEGRSFLGSGLNVTGTQKLLLSLNKAAVKSIQSPDGDIIDCVLLHHQLAFDHPKLADHKLQEAPSSWPRGIVAESNSSQSSDEELQLWHRMGRCPTGTIPVRRTKAEDILRAVAAKKSFGRKTNEPLIPSSPPGAPQDSSSYGHEHAIAYVRGHQFHGAQASINVWRPRIQVSHEFSLSQMWLLSGSFVRLNSIEAGWQVSPELYGDINPRFFTYWTSDGYQSTGCYNLLCSGFIQVGHGIALGASISPVSSFSGAQYDINILIWKDPRTGNWWMAYGQNSVVGYWPAELFPHLRSYATMIEWGGEVVNTRPGGKHTATQMGSGHFPEQGFSQASYIRNIGLVDSRNQLQLPSYLHTLAQRPRCYDIKSSYNKNWGLHVYYGGPGQNPGCR